nr:MAG TPA: hypothetical protein [Caudoviricetes sp.]
MGDTKQFEEFVPEKRTVTIRGQEYLLREMSLSEKIDVLGPIAEALSEAVKVIGLKRSEGGGGFGIDVPERFSLSDLQIEAVVIRSAKTLKAILEKSIPDFTDWDNLPESQTREPLKAAVEVNDFLGFLLNFIHLGASAIRSLTR